MVKYIYKDEDTRVKAVYLRGEFLYTVTYTVSKDGYIVKMVRVYKDGTVETQEF